MNPDMPSPAAPPGPETPPASLTMVRVKRRSTAQSNRKRGDLTEQLEGGKPEAAKREIAALFAKPSPAKPTAAPPCAEPDSSEPETVALFSERAPRPPKQTRTAAPEPAPVEPSPDEPEMPLFAEREKKPLAEEPAALPSVPDAAAVLFAAEAVASLAAEPEMAPDFSAPEEASAPAPEEATVTAGDAAAPAAADAETAPPSHSTPFLAGLKVLRKFIKASARPSAPAPEPEPSAAAEPTAPPAAPEAVAEAAPAASEPETAPLAPLPDFSLETPLEPELVLLPEPEPEPEPEATVPLLPFAEASKRRITAERFGEGSTPAEPAEDSAEIVPLMDARAGDSVESPPAPETAEEASANPADVIIDYWDGLRGGRDFPSIDQLDRALIADSWPNSVLLSFPAAQPDMPRISRLGEPNGEVEYNAMVTEWILSRGRHSAKRGRPMEEEQRFPVASGSARYRLLLLPFSSNGIASDHVLCHVSRTEELSTVASFKRWLAL